MLEKIGIHYIDLKRLRDNPVIVDAGACMGTYIETVNKKIPNCRIMAIECDRGNIKILKEKNFHNVTLCEKALVGKRHWGKLIYHKYTGLPYSGTVGYEKTYIKKDKHKCRGVVRYEVETLGINDIFSEFGIDYIDYLKLNIEGSEREVLAAMTEEAASKIGQVSVSIHVKIHDDLMKSPLADTAGTDAIQRLTELGFNASHVDRRLTYGVREV